MRAGARKNDGGHFVVAYALSPNPYPGTFAKPLIWLVPPKNQRPPSFPRKREPSDFERRLRFKDTGSPPTRGRRVGYWEQAGMASVRATLSRKRGRGVSAVAGEGATHQIKSA
ncbi:hypothetical protein CBM2587_A20004 [Cupriavidus taiwanensis]|uniref:Uncharacterized protein n=1 Tax=Cupriavidus taiwanensis TaxID=164546 RepID=A0A975WZA3_9BURK|nr:hypothetical protein CBM2587_A20004 [Cupriavidus taiwanensis]